MDKIAIIGCGPMGLYALKRLVASDSPLSIFVYDRAERPGAGMPYSSAFNTDQMLCNAFSREIPGVTRPFADWLRDRDDAFLGRWGLTADDADTRAFYPRTLLGAYLASEFEALCLRGTADDHRIHVFAGHEVSDIDASGAGVRIAGEVSSARFEHFADHAIIATGHRWEDRPRIDDVPIGTPWPAAALDRVPAARVGVIGASLSAIDIALTLGARHGSFDDTGGRVRWFAKDDSAGFRLTLLSLDGVMPEADFHYPYPYEPLRHLTVEHVEQEIASSADGLLERVFDLLVRDLDAADPSYLATLGDAARTVEGFPAAYFARRAEVGGFRSVRETFAEARQAMDRKETIPHRYVLLRADAVFDRVLRHLTEADYARFEKHLLPVIADAYAAVPHRSVARLLAMHEAGVLDLQPTGRMARYAARAGGGVSVDLEDGRLEFDAMIDARGQKSAPLSALPFPTLVSQISDDPVTPPFRLVSRDGAALSVHCLAMPQLLERQPFSQGLANCADLAASAVDDLLGDGRDDARRIDVQDALRPVARPPVPAVADGTAGPATLSA